MPLPFLPLAALMLVLAHPAGAIDPPASLLVVDLQEGDGRVAETGLGASVHYTGWLFDPGVDTADPCQAVGERFDSSRNRQRPFNFPLGEGRVIAGWDQGIQGMRVGGQRCLVIPPHMAYGKRGAGNVIPPDSTLVFEVELLSLQDY